MGVANGNLRHYAPKELIVEGTLSKMNLKHPVAGYLNPGTKEVKLGSIKYRLLSHLDLRFCPAKAK